MDLDQLKQILELVRAHDLTDFEIEHEGLRLKIRKDATGTAAVAPAPMPVAPPAVATAVTRAPASASESSSLAEASEEIELAVVKSPIVGTFYRSPEPESAAFVEIGSAVKKAQVLCI